MYLYVALASDIDCSLERLPISCSSFRPTHDTSQQCVAVRFSTAAAASAQFRPTDRTSQQCGPGRFSTAAAASAQIIASKCEENLSPKNESVGANCKDKMEGSNADKLKLNGDSRRGTNDLEIDPPTSWLSL
jgi:hypothetical protein